MSSSNDETKPLLSDPSSLDGDLKRVLDARGLHEPSPAEIGNLTAHLAAILPPGTLPPSSGGGGGGGGGAAGSALGGAKGLIVTAAAIALLGGGGVLVGTQIHKTTTTTIAQPTATAVTIAISSSAAPDPSPPPSAPVADPPASASARPIKAAPSGSSPLPETTLLANAHEQLLKGSPERALAITNEHARAYPHGSLEQEREVIAIEALVALSRREEANRRAAAFHRSFPQSSHRDRLDRITR